MNTFTEVPANKMSLSRRKLIHGAGFNDADYIVVNGRSRCPFYNKWAGMITRCYSTKFQEKQPTYIGCSVVDEWLTFSRFRKWMETQDWEGKELDKDLLLPGNKVYGPEFCIFVPRSLNGLLVDHGSARGEWPTGVCFDKQLSRFKARCNVNGKHKHLGCFSTPGEASRTYKDFKTGLIRSIARDYVSNSRLYNGLIAHAELIQLT